MNPIASIIRKQLLASRAVSIPSFGTIAVLRHGAALTDGGLRLITPIKELVISDDQAVSVIDYTMDDLGVDQLQATLQYNQWIENATQDDYLIVDGVGAFEIAGSRVELTAEFASMLNPLPSDRVVVRRGNENNPQTQLRPQKSSNTFWVILAIVAAVAAAAYLTYYFFDDLTELIERLLN